MAKWTGFDPLDKSTWGLKSRSNIIPNWTDEQKQKICVYLRKPLFVKDDSVILRFVDAIVNLTIDKEREGNGWHKDYLQTWMKSNFPTINCGKAQKRQAILVALQELGIIHPLFKGRPKLFVTRWTLGEMAQEVIGEVAT